MQPMCVGALTTPSPMPLPARTTSRATRSRGTTGATWVAGRRAPQHFPTTRWAAKTCKPFPQKLVLNSEASADVGLGHSRAGMKRCPGTLVRASGGATCRGSAAHIFLPRACSRLALRSLLFAHTSRNSGHDLWAAKTAPRFRCREDLGSTPAPSSHCRFSRLDCCHLCGSSSIIVVVIFGVLGLCCSAAYISMRSSQWAWARACVARWKSFASPSSMRRRAISICRSATSCNCRSTWQFSAHRLDCVTRCALLLGRGGTIAV